MFSTKIIIKWNLYYIYCFLPQMVKEISLNLIRGGIWRIHLTDSHLIVLFRFFMRYTRHTYRDNFVYMRHNDPKIDTIVTLARLASCSSRFDVASIIKTFFKSFFFYGFVIMLTQYDNTLYWNVYSQAYYICKYEKYRIKSFYSMLIKCFNSSNTCC